jgi:conjugative relaxase-like TrwC/TraI family protein
MLGVHRVGPGRAGYYLSDPALELPAPVLGCWIGFGASDLGLEDSIDSSGFCRLLAGQHPRTGRLLASGRATVAAYDLTFSAPKSVSVLYALGGADVARGVLGIHREAVTAALRYVERRALAAARRAGASTTIVPADGAVAALFTHGVSRTLDPHVHSHLVLANVVHGADGRWSTVDGRGLIAHRQAASAVYGAHLRAGLTATFGARWVATPSATPELAGVHPALIGAFSTRRTDILVRRREMGVRSRHGHVVAWASTRPPKHQGGATFQDLSVLWAARARDVVGCPSVHEDAFGRALPQPTLDEHRYAATISLTAHGGAHRRDVVAAFGAAAREGLDQRALDSFVRDWVPHEPDGAVGVAEVLHRRRDVVPGNHLLRALGPRPATPPEHQLWLSAAQAIDAYRGRWDIRGAVAMGADDPVALAAMAPRRLADHVRTARLVETVRTQLGHRVPQAVELGLAR